jgi:dihydrofolate reductase
MGSQTSSAKEEAAMRRLVVIEFLSLDGVMQAPGAPDEDTDGGFRHGGWQVPYVDDVLGADAADGMASTDAYLFGRRTYEIMARRQHRSPRKWHPRADAHRE